jgi:hypothetical protein
VLSSRDFPRFLVVVVLARTGLFRCVWVQSWVQEIGIDHRAGAVVLLARMSDPRQLAEIRTYDDLLAAIRLRIAELDIAQATVDDVAGVQSGYIGKLLAKPPLKTPPLPHVARRYPRHPRCQPGHGRRPRCARLRPCA